MASGQKKESVKAYQKKRASYTDLQLQTLIFSAQKLSNHYHQKFPCVETDEFFSIALVAIAEALRSYQKNKGTLHSWTSHYIYARFHNFLVRKYKKQQMILNKLIKMGYFYINSRY